MVYVAWLRLSVVLILGVIAVRGGERSDLEEQMRVLGKQVTALLNKRTEDLKSIEDNMRRKLSHSQEFIDVREEIKGLRWVFIYRYNVDLDSIICLRITMLYKIVPFVKSRR